MRTRLEALRSRLHDVLAKAQGVEHVQVNLPMRRVDLGPDAGANSVEFAARLELQMLELTAAIAQEEALLRVGERQRVAAARR